jgi:hypothetical protein
MPIDEQDEQIKALIAVKVQEERNRCIRFIDQQKANWVEDQLVENALRNISYRISKGDHLL